MSEQPSLFDAPQAKAARDEAIDRVEQNAAETFKAAAERAILHVARSRNLLTTDDVWKLLHQWETTPPREARAMGAVMRRMGAEGWIEPTDEWRLSMRPACHRRPLRVWRSKARA